ncbi:MAG: efflux RND transporter periplasmic adaptor subunit [Candidatus Marinimicrobia bacterium]|nr:efflux RND transporter periplasmic adaptor subunit [Candidatus Neomarinimicrobiota bacterium]
MNINAIKYVLIAVLVISALLVTDGCGTKEGEIHQIGNLNVSFWVVPDPPSVGENEFKVKLTDAGGQPVTNASVGIKYFMPAMAGMPAMGSELEAEHNAEGLYSVILNLSMGGTFPWDVTVTINRKGENPVSGQWRVTSGKKGTPFLSSSDGASEDGMEMMKMDEGSSMEMGEQDNIMVGKKSKALTFGITPYQQQLIGVKKDSVRIRKLISTIKTVGHVVRNENLISSVNMRFGGWIDTLHIKYVGQKVLKDEPLMNVYSPDLIEAQEEYLQTFGAREIVSVLTAESSGKSKWQRNDLRRSAELKLRLLGMTDEQMKGILKHKRPDLSVLIQSPRTGYIVEMNTMEGSYFKTGTDLFIIADLSSVWVHAEVYEYEASYVKIGQEARIFLTYDSGTAYVGKVQYIYPSVNLDTRTVKLQIEFPNPDMRLKPGMYADVEIEIDAGEGITVPRSAVLTTGTRHLVFIDRGNGRFEPRDISVAGRSNEYYLVSEGLKEGEVVVTSANFLIDSEAQMRGVLKHM